MIKIEAATWFELRERIVSEGLQGIMGIYRCKQGKHVMIFQLERL
jgi:hypothetical protein